jgi:flavorubredoxin
MPSTLWGFDTRGRVLFSADGFAYSHEDNHCGLTAEEAVSLNLREAASMFAEGKLLWERSGRLDHLIQRLGVKTIAPTHGLPITDVKAMMRKILGRMD